MDKCLGISRNENRVLEDGVQSLNICDMCPDLVQLVTELLRPSIDPARMKHQVVSNETLSKEFLSFVRKDFYLRGKLFLQERERFVDFGFENFVNSS